MSCINNACVWWVLMDCWCIPCSLCPWLFPAAERRAQCVPQSGGRTAHRLWLGLLTVVYRETSSVSWWFTPPWNQKRRGTGNWEGAWKSVWINWDTPSTYRPGVPDSTAWFIIDQVGISACCHGYVFTSLSHVQSLQMSSDGAWYRETKLSSDAAADEESTSTPRLAPARGSAASHRTCGTAANLH